MDAAQRLTILVAVRSLKNSGGGAERNAVALSQYFAQSGHDVVLVTFDSNLSETFYAVDPSIELVGLGIGYATRRATAREVARQCLAFMRFRRRRIDVAIGFSRSTSVPLMAGMGLFGVPVIAREAADYFAYRNLSRSVKLFLAFLALRSSAVVSLSEGARTSYPKWLAHRMTVIPNILDRASFSHADPIARHERQNVVLAVSRLEPQKRIEALIMAFALASEDLHEWRLEIIGDGSMRFRLEALAEHHGLGPRCLFHGAVRNVSEALARSAIFVLPSMSEGFPNALAEALLHGVPSIAFSDCPGVAELVVSGRNGIIIGREAEIENLGEALRSLMMSRDLRDSLASFDSSWALKFMPENIGSQWERLIQSVLGSTE